MSAVIKGHLICDDKAAPLGDCRVEAPYRVKDRLMKPSLEKLDEQPVAPARPGQLSARTDAKGHFVIPLPLKVNFAESSLNFSVFSPSGALIGQADFPIEALAKEIAIRVKSGRLAAVGPENTSPIEPTERRVRGRVVDRAGKGMVSAIQVILVGVVDDARQSEIPQLVTRADATGTFGGMVPIRTFASAYALVDGLGQHIPLVLENGHIPADMILLIDLPAEATREGGDCGCGGQETPRTPTQGDIENSPGTYSTDLGTGGCVNFNVPNRAIEEFSFYTVVRTTEPGIVGFSQDDGFARPAAGSSALLASLEADVAATAAAVAAAMADAARIASNAGQGGTEWQLRRDVIMTLETQRGYIENLIEENIGKPEANVKANLAAEIIKLGNTSPVAQAIVDMLSGPVSGTKAITNVWQNRTNAQTLYTDCWNLARSLLTLASRSGDDNAAAIAAANARVTAARNAAAAAAAALAARREELAREQALQAARDAQKTGGRARLSASNPVDWDETPHFYQAAEIAHGHLLHFKQVWYSDGYSLGDLLYSVPLAPGQKRLISIIDWERREEASQDENTRVSEDLSTSLGRDRDLSEVVKGAITESSRGGSRSTTAGVGVGTGAAGNGSYQGFNFGALLGISGGYGEANSSAWQDSARNASADSLQRLRDRTMQSASAVRSQRATVVRAVRQGEAVRATTEVIANHNHCHAMTVQYFEVLRHLKLTQELVNVQECLFVPLPMTTFDLAKTLRWRNELATYLKRTTLNPAFDAARRVQTNWSDVDYPNQQYADERIDSISGEFLLTVIVPPPPFPERPRPRPEDTLEQTAKAVNEATNPTTGVLGILLAVATGGASLVTGLATNAAINATSAASKGARALAEDYYAELDPQRRYDRFNQEVVPGVVESFVNLLSLEIKVRGQSPVRIDGADFTLVSSYQPGIPLAVALRANLDGRFKRSDIEQIVLKSTVPLPPSFRAIVNSARLSYRTPRFEHRLVDDPRVNDDLESPVATAVFTNVFDLRIEAVNVGQQRGVTLYAPLDQWEQLNPRNEDRRLTAELVAHLNDNFEYYHHAIWWTMDPNRRYMLLDGYYAPNSDNRSVASVVENRLIGIVGNSLILPVASGVRLDPRFRPNKDGNWIDLLGFYQPPIPLPATRISLPTKGVFAEAVMGNCNSCEEIDESRFWRWEQSPIDEPPAINALSTDSRRSDTGSLQAKDMPAPLVAIQTTPTAPDAGGVKVVLDALGKSVFTDITGLEGTQKNAAAAYQQALDSAYKFGKEASTLAQQAAMLNSLDKSMSAIDKAEAGGKIDADKAKQLRTTALEQIVGTKAEDAKAPANVKKRLDVISDAIKSDAITSTDGRAHSNAVLKNLAGESPASESDTAISNAIKKASPENASLLKAQTPDGASIELVQAKGGQKAPSIIYGSPANNLVDGIDASVGDIGWETVAESGIRFAFIRAAFGANKVAKGNQFRAWFMDNWRSMRDTGLIRGAYQFFRPSEDAGEQAEEFMNLVGPLRPGDLPPVLDLEIDPYDPTYIADHTKIIGPHTMASYLTAVEVWLNLIEQHYKVRPIIYTSKKFWADATNDDARFIDYPLWVCSVNLDKSRPTAPNFPAPWGDWDFWQYAIDVPSNDDLVPGVKGTTDLNLFNGDDLALARFARFTVIGPDSKTIDGGTA
ncbi:hypothetical protein LZ012_03035 [Dechloromonas sp. XY25]|uniref:Uncharacterized protein n=1 Tax=Dechloromonas hankyongensis TaxID=2908002 RepID=A0ABS9JYH6_9RHOO|nr:GH25 family lysozyme [Dechloromonas hankyongensis]MCG2575967.1 hypothetical protein [Dechloromonas hankyongensis]